VRRNEWNVSPSVIRATPTERTQEETFHAFASSSYASRERESLRLLAVPELLE
jgi:hypothetical protein